MAGWSGEGEAAVVWPSLGEAGQETFLAAQLEPGERGAAAAHLARAAFDRRTAAFRSRRDEAPSELVRLERDRVPAAEALRALLDPHRAHAAARGLASLALELGEGAARAAAEGAAAAGRWLRAVDAPPHPDGGPSAADRVEAAEALLAGTEDALGAVVQRFGVEAYWEWPARLRTERALFRPERRPQRIAADIDGLGLRSALAQHVRVAPVAPNPVRARVAARRVPGETRLADVALDGVAGEHLAAEGLGRALGLALVSPALPIPLRRPVAGTVSRALGMLLAQVVGDPIVLRRRGATGAEVSRSVRAFSALLLLRARLEAAACLAATRPRVVWPELVGRALGAAPSPESAWLLETSAASPRFRATTSSLALFVALRERFDEDFFRNPRVAEVIRGAAARGGAFSAEGFLAELGGDPTDAIGRLDEVVERGLG